jgi:hypothetical protein
MLAVELRPFQIKCVAKAIKKIKDVILSLLRAAWKKRRYTERRKDTSTKKRRDMKKRKATKKKLTKKVCFFLCFFLLLALSVYSVEQQLPFLLLKMTRKKKGVRK